MGNVTQPLLRSFAVSVLAICAALIPATVRAQTTTASVAGDVYLVTRSGDVKPVASNTVYLIPESVASAAVASVCRDAYAAIGGRLRRSMRDVQEASDSAYERWEIARKADPDIGLPDSASLELRVRFLATRDSVEAFDREWPGTSSVLLAGELQRAGTAARTGMRAHYEFGDFPPGRYIIWAETALLNEHYHWWVPAELESGKAAKIDLDNSLVTEGRRRCN